MKPRTLAALVDGLASPPASPPVCPRANCRIPRWMHAARRLF